MKNTLRYVNTFRAGVPQHHTFENTIFVPLCNPLSLPVDCVGELFKRSKNLASLQFCQKKKIWPFCE